jgi:hypothetical protein
VGFPYSRQLSHSYSAIQSYPRAALVAVVVFHAPLLLVAPGGVTEAEAVTEPRVRELRHSCILHALYSVIFPSFRNERQR